MKVLVAMDHSEVSQAALKAIGPWARAAGAQVVLLTVRQPSKVHETVQWRYTTAVPQGTPGGQLMSELAEVPPPATENRAQAFERIRDETEALLRADAAKYLDGVACEFAISVADDIPAAIATFAKDNAVDFIAMGTHGRQGVKHLLMGSVAEAVLRTSTVPVLMVREGMRAPAGT